MDFFETFLGQKVEIGDYIAYPDRRGSSLWMNVAQVLGIEEKEDHWWPNKTYLAIKVLKLDDSRRYGGKEPKVTWITSGAEKAVKINL